MTTLPPLPALLTMSMGANPHYLAGWNDCHDEFTRALAAVPAPIVVQPQMDVEDARDMVARHQKACLEYATSFDGADALYAEMILARKVLVAALTAPAVLAVQPTPPGWKLVPIEPTHAMVSAGYEHTLREIEDDDDSDGANEYYRARGQAIAAYMDMLAAAPEHGISAPVGPTPTEITEE